MGVPGDQVVRTDSDTVSMHERIISVLLTIYIAEQDPSGGRKLAQSDTLVTVSEGLVPVQAARANAKQTEAQFAAMERARMAYAPRPMPTHNPAAYIPESTKRRMTAMSPRERREFEAGYDKRPRTSAEHEIPKHIKKRAAELYKYAKKPVCWRAMAHGEPCAASAKCDKAPCCGFGKDADADSFYRESNIRK